MKVEHRHREAAWPFAGFHCLPDSQMTGRWWAGYYDDLPQGSAIRAFVAFECLLAERQADTQVITEQHQP